MQLSPIGYISRAHGLKGHVLLKAQRNVTEDINVIFLEANGSQAPFFIEEITIFNKDYLLKLEEVNSIDEANKLKNTTVFAEEKFILEEETFEFLNYKLIDSEKGEVGEIEELIDNPGNPLLKIMNQQKEILLPFNKDLILKIDKKKKELFYNSPAGLLDLFL